MARITSTSVKVKTTSLIRSNLPPPRRMCAHSQSAASRQIPNLSPSRNSSKLIRRSLQLPNNRSISHGKSKRLFGRNAKRWIKCLLIMVWNVTNSLRRRESAPSSLFTWFIRVARLTNFPRSGAFSNVYKALDLTLGIYVAGTSFSPLLATFMSHDLLNFLSQGGSQV